MINPSNVTIDIEEQRLWMVDHKASTGMSWSQLEKPVDVNGKTLGLFCGGKYAGDNQKIAECIFRYRQNLSAQARIKIEAPDIPPYFETRTSQEIQHILAWAHRGRMTLFAGGPGTSKTISANEYRERVSNAWIVTMCPSIKTVPTMTLKVLRAMGDTSARINYLLSSYVRGKFKDRQGVLIVDEAQHLNVDLIEELRNWHDETGVGLAFLGNEQIVARMEGGSRQAEFAQLYSRVSLRLIRPVPLKEDIEALADAWQIQDEAVFAFILRIGRKPGGMRSCTFTLELAKMIAESQSAELGLAHVTAAWNQLSTRPIAA